MTWLCLSQGSTDSLLQKSDPVPVNAPLAGAMIKDGYTSFEISEAALRGIEICGLCTATACLT